MQDRSRKKRHIGISVLLIVLPIAAVLLSLFCGRFPISPTDVLGALFSPSSVSHAAAVTVRQLRLPRAVAAAFVGASLSVSGAAFQSVFRNPLVNSGIMGVSNGAGFGACLAIVFFGGGVFTYGLSFLFGLAAVALSYFAGRIALEIDKTERQAVLSICDFGAPFDPLRKEDPDISLSAEDREIGGLGIFVVRKTMDKVEYERQNGQNILTLTKSFDKAKKA